MDNCDTDILAAARAEGDGLMAGPRATHVHYDSARHRIIVRLSSGVELGFSPRDAEGLEHASRLDLRQVEIEEFGLAIHFPTLDADFYVPGLIEGRLGSERWMLARALRPAATERLASPVTIAEKAVRDSRILQARRRQVPASSRRRVWP